MAKKEFNWNIVIGIVIIIILLYGIKSGSLKSSSTETIITEKTIINQLEQTETSPSCTLSATPTTVTVGGIVKGTIKDGAQKTCNVYYKTDGNWIFHQSVKTDIDGIFTGNQIMPAEGTYQFKAICDGCVTNSITITVIKSANPLDSDGDGYTNEQEIASGTDPYDKNSYPNGGTSCDYECKDDGYESGKAVSSCGMCVTGELCEVYKQGSQICCCKQKETISKCMDSDGGAYSNAYGVCYDGKLSKLNPNKDTCTDFKGVLTEWYCSNDACTSKTMSCPFGYVCTDGYCHQLLCSDIKDPISQRDCDKGGCRGACSYVYNSQTDTDSCECVSKCSSRYAELGYSYYYYYSEADYPYGQDSRVCSAKANHECQLLGKSVPLWLTVPYGLYGEQLEGRCCMWVCVG